MKVSLLKPFAALLLALPMVVVPMTVLRAAPAGAQECGCTNVGPWKAPATAAPLAAQTSPSGKYTLSASQSGSFVVLTVRQAATNTTVHSFNVPILRAAWGFSPDDDRFMIRNAAAATSTTLDDVVLYDLAANRQVYQNTLAAGFAAAFSPHGKWFLTDAVSSPGFAGVNVINSVTGASAVSTSVIFSNPPGGSGDVFGSTGTGFSSEPDDRSFVLAYLTTSGTVSLSVYNLATQARVVDESNINSGAFWRFSPCGDAFGLATQSSQSYLSARMYKTVSIGNLGSAQQVSLPASVSFNSTLDWHQLKVTTSQGTTYTNVASNTADNACTTAPALAAITLDRAAVVGGTQNATATLALTAAATTALTVTLSSSNSSAATVPSNVTVASGANTRTFTVTSHNVTSAKAVTISATAAGVSKTATLTVNPAPPTPQVVSLTAAPSSVPGGTTSTATITLSAAAPSTGATVQLSSTGPVTVPTSTVVTPGQTTKQFTIAASAVTADTSATVTASAGGASASVDLTVLADVVPQSPHAVVDDPACRTATLAANDDGSTGPVALPFVANFFGHQYGYLYVNNNGNVTFNAPMSTYTPFRITSQTPPIIAPFFADVDTRGSGSQLVSYSTEAGPGTFAGRPAFCVNWVNVGYYSTHTDKLNSFQLLLVDRSDVDPGDFDIVMNYDQIQWETGDASGGSGGYGGNAAGAGYSAGTGDPSQFFEFPGTLVPGSLLDSNASTGLTRTSRGTLQLGRHIFEVRNGTAPTGGTLTGVVSDAATPPHTLAGAPVQVCPEAGGLCLALTLTGATGRYQVAGIPEGNYLITASPPAGSTLDRATVGPVTVTAGQTTQQDIVLRGPTPPPDGTTISPSTTNGQGIPNVYWGDPLDLETHGCPGGAATYQLSQGSTVAASGPMSEAPAGTYTAQIPALRPVHGPAQITIRIDCPAGTPDQEAVFDIYIDPSGTVLTLGGNPVPDATVTLLRSDSQAGPFTEVVDGSPVMSPPNRSNPDMTNGAGHFGWDVIAGYYKVRAERAGCTAPDGSPYAETDVLPVPPPVTDLVLRLDCPDLDAQDSEPPSVTATPARAANDAGWYDAPVTVHFSATDDGTPPSGVASITVDRAGAETGSTTFTGDSGDVTVSADGATTLTYTATDNAGNTSQPQALVVRVDKVAPTLDCAVTPAVLFPPNHTLRDVNAVVTVSDGGSGAAGFLLTSVTSDEPDNGLGDGDTAADMRGWTAGTPDTAGQLRAERSGNGDGRVYTLTYQGSDLAGNSATCSAVVTVPKSASR